MARQVRSRATFCAAIVAVLAALVLSTSPSALADDRMQFTGTTLSGAPFNGSSLSGKPAVLWFWTPWCPFCNAEAPSVSAVAAAHPGVTFVGVAARSDVAAMQGFVDKYNLGSPISTTPTARSGRGTTCPGSRPTSSIARTARRRS